MNTSTALLSALACLVLASTSAPASASAGTADAPHSAGLPARAASAKLKVTVPSQPILATPGTWISLEVTVRNTARAKARKIAVVTTVPQGASLSSAKVRLGSIAPRKDKTARVWVRIDTAAAAVVSISASSKRSRTTSKKVTLTPTPPPPPGVETAWRGNFMSPTDEGIGFTLSADGTSITGWSAPRVYGYCTDQGSGFAWYPDTSIDSIPVDPAGHFVGTRSYVDSGGYNHTLQVSGTLSGTTVIEGSLTHTATWEHEGTQAVCSIADAQQTWSAAQG